MKNSLNLWLLAILSSVILIAGGTPTKVHAFGPESKTFIEREIECLAKNIYFEAGNETYEGKVAVAQVTINRSEDDRYPDTVCNVVKQKTTFANRIICQFSWVCDKKQPKMNYDRWNESLAVARDVLVEGMRLSALSNALYFHNTTVRPNWGKVRVARIGNHVFYRDPI